MKYFKLITLLFFSFLMACDSGPQVIEAESATTNNTSSNSEGGHSFHDVPQPQNNANTEHKVVAQEVLNTDKYTYIQVSEEDQNYWVAITKMPVEIGATYYFKGGLLKKNFFSREHNRTFETVYLVSNIRKQPAGVAGGGSAVDQALNRLKGNGAGQVQVNVSPNDIQPAEGSIKLSDLFAAKENYAGKKIKVTGKCVKVNPMIMGRNWIHLQDGSGDKLDLTITTTENIPVGHVITLEGTIALNKDFGAGYKYDIIMEEAVLQ